MDLVCNAVAENDGLKSVFGVRGCFLAHFKAENKFNPMHTPLLENTISEEIGFTSVNQLKCQNDIVLSGGPSLIKGG